MSSLALVMIVRNEEKFIGRCLESASSYIHLLIELKEYSTVLDLIQREHSWLDHFPDYHFACGGFYLDLIISNPEQYISFLPRIEAAYKKCIEIGETSIYDSVIGVGSFAAWYNLGNYYEVLGQRDKAIHCYQESARMGFDKAEQQLKALQ